MKRYIIKKLVFAKNIKAAAKLEKEAEIFNITLDEEIEEAKTRHPMGFQK